MTVGAVGAVIVAAGRGVRMGGGDKCALTLGGEPVLLHSVRAFAAVVDRLVVVVAPDRVAYWEVVMRSTLWPRIHALVAGGTTRSDSVFAGVAALTDRAEVATILIHDGARPLVTDAIIRATIAGATAHGAVIAAVPVTDTIKRVRDDVVIETPDRATLWAAQTPQGFGTYLLHAAFARARQTGSGPFTDESAMVEADGVSVRIVRGDPTNIKVTNRDDLMIAEALLRARSRTDG